MSSEEDLSADAPGVMSRQATLNVGCVGHVAHGKSTVVRALSGVRTVRFRRELERNITIKLGYANAKIFKCDLCPPPQCFTSGPSSSPSSVRCVGGCGGEARLVRHVSFVDCPGHEVLMATMLGGAAVMDAALLLVAADEPCPQPQTREHLAALEAAGPKHLIVLQNKVDLVEEKRARRHHLEIADFVRGTAAEGAPVLPVSAQLALNMDAVCDHLARIPLPLRDSGAAPRLAVVRSFDVNRPGCAPDELRGGVAGGSLLRGVLRLGQEVELRPGLVRRDEGGRLVCSPLRTRVVSLFAEQNSLEVAVPGGLIGVGTLLDPTLSRADRLAGQVLGLGVPAPLCQLEVAFFLLRRLLGVAGKGARVKGLAKGETLMLNCGALATGARVLAVKSDMAKLQLSQPVCAEAGDKVALSRRIERHWRLVGWAQIKRGEQADEQ
ncbi:hypothetical protein JTE90_008611 [Oedothorax gibbosus]|uniref:protein-synthesizing GTPase n=1 Tax=Oedothorax gibbosus TaxID=931172 RepID=A0AAV6UDF1_9ARAC|nr:hypothetical protein JTE90_008611 [Oedothorax gibbosus]